jgi:hypothetical protein
MIVYYPDQTMNINGKFVTPTASLLAKYGIPKHPHKDIRKKRLGETVVIFAVTSNGLRGRSGIRKKKLQSL